MLFCWRQHSYRRVQSKRQCQGCREAPYSSNALLSRSIELCDISLPSCGLCHYSLPHIFTADARIPALQPTQQDHTDKIEKLSKLHSSTQMPRRLKSLGHAWLMLVAHDEWVTSLQRWRWRHHELRGWLIQWVVSHRLRWWSSHNNSIKTRIITRQKQYIQKINTWKWNNENQNMKMKTWQWRVLTCGISSAGKLVSEIFSE